MKKIKSYARTVGKGLSPLCRSLLKETLPKYQIAEQELILKNDLHIEIGFGSGDFIYNLALQNPEQNFLGIEVYMNSVCNLLKLCQIRPLNNLFIYIKDADLLLQNLRNNSVETFYIFFPDPWHKNKHKKRRFLNKMKIELITKKLKKLGKIKFITDVEDYFTQVSREINEHPLLKRKNVSNDSQKFIEEHKPCDVALRREEFNRYIPNMSVVIEQEFYLTKYYLKALENGKTIFPLIAHKES